MNNTTTTAKQHRILVFAQNKRGVLERITMLIRRKMYNLEQITASDTERDGIKRITICFSHQEGAKLKQIALQIEKIVEVIEARIIDNETSFCREVGLIKIQKPKSMPELLKLTEMYSTEIIHVGDQDLIIQVVGTSRRIQDLIKLLKDFGILEWSTSGGISMEG